MKPKTDRMDANADSAGATTQLDVRLDAKLDREPRMGSRDGVVAELIRELTRRERLVLMLRYTEELTVAEIAAVLEVAATEVERMLESITERVRRRVQPSYGRPRTSLA
jgi:RNA polymerase sigma factor (sigma-70 family)